jgi:rSAM/selenodomain-associated transferase 2
MISIVIPIFNEEKNIHKFLSQFEDSSGIEIILVDGGSTDKTKEKIKQFKKNNNYIKLFTSDKLGRANQMNYGASLSKGNILLFLHADTILPSNYQQIVENIVKNEKVIMGAFKLSIDGSKKSLRLIEKMVNVRSRLFSLPYGDQGFFLTKKKFELLEGFADLPIMEDFNFVRRAKSKGKIEISNVAVVTSDRRWQKLGVAKTTIINQLVIIGYYLNVSPQKLNRFYRYSIDKNN